MYSQNDYRLYLEHSWGKKPEQKAAEKAYNQKYYQEHKDKWAEYRKKAVNGMNEFLDKSSDEIGKGLEDAADMLFSIGGVREAQQLHDAEVKRMNEQHKYNVALSKNQHDRKYAQDVDKMYKDAGFDKDPFFSKSVKAEHDSNWAAARESGKNVNSAKVRQASDEYRKALKKFKSTPLGKATTAMEGAVDRIAKKHGYR